MHKGISKQTAYRKANHKGQDLFKPFFIDSKGEYAYEGNKANNHHTQERIDPNFHSLRVIWKILFVK